METNNVCNFFFSEWKERKRVEPDQRAFRKELRNRPIWVLCHNFFKGLSLKPVQHDRQNFAKDIYEDSKKKWLEMVLSFCE